MAYGLSDELFSRLVVLRRWFHQHPELAFEEADTAQRIIRELERLKIDYDYAGIGHAVIGHVAGLDSTRPVIGLRAEMDALPGDETTGVAYASVNPGKMHACGHGAHMAMLIGAAELLCNDSPPGPVRLIFQPAEERGGGARTAIADGALQNVAAIFAGHVTHDYHTGQIMVRDGVVTAQSDRFSIRIRGRGGHGARPHEAVDAVVISGFLIIALQTLVSRETNPFHPTVVTIGKIHAGSAPNVIAEEAILEGSIRTSNPDVRQHILRGIERMISAAAELHNAKITVEFGAGYPPVINDPAGAAIAREAASRIVGADNVVGSEHPSMGSEDFSFFLEHVPGAFVRFGAREERWAPVPLHSPAFDIDEKALAVGARFYDQVVRTAHGRIGAEFDGV
ncbi:MAG: M20 family metallopeptidase [Gammaproteobacteria bacterium]|nr:M20 family metallopeptidase [Gammaproteobacteria bacterium]MDH3362409.1 M20 family metallopeptidase [Gammaproteobacteria bacterium]MDH3481415.1 M20 family metallopeptidase [Gammaproteobacteria bacterium]